jgi:preprotein translocase subunit SecE
MTKTSPWQFVQQVRQEVSKVTWTSRKETVVTTTMVVIMVFCASIFFFVVDWFLGNAVKAILGLGS